MAHHKQLSLPARILFWPWKVLNQPVYWLSRIIRSRTKRGSILWQFAAYTPLRVTGLSVTVLVLLFSVRHHWIHEETVSLIKEFWRAMLVYPMAEYLATFFIEAEQEAMPIAEAAEQTAETIAKL